MDLRARGPLDALVITGPVSLDNARLAGFSLGSQLGSVLNLAGIRAPKDTVIRHGEAALTIAPSGIRADPARADVADLGKLTGQGSMAADGRLDFRMLVKLDRAITGAGQTGQGLGGLLGESGAGRLLGGVLGGTTEQGIGVRGHGHGQCTELQDRSGRCHQPDQGRARRACDEASGGEQTQAQARCARQPAEECAEAEKRALSATVEIGADAPYLVGQVP